MIKIQCEQCGKKIETTLNACEVSCVCGARYWLNRNTLEYGRIIPEATSFYPPGEPTRDTCIAELLKALQKKREADREIEFWERKLRCVKAAEKI